VLSYAIRFKTILLYRSLGFREFRSFVFFFLFLSALTFARFSYVKLAPAEPDNENIIRNYSHWETWGILTAVPLAVCPPIIIHIDLLLFLAQLDLMWK